MTIEGQTYVNLVLEELGVRGLARVLSVEDYDGPTDGARVTGAITHQNNALYRLVLSNDETFTTTKLHPFYSLDKKRWTRAHELITGERLVTRDGEITVKSCERIPGLRQVFNLEINGLHNYFVGKTNLLSHNATPCAETPKPNGPIKPKSRNQMQKEVETGKAPSSVERVDPPHDPRGQSHIHIKGQRAAINKDGSWRDAGQGTFKPSQDVLDWIKQNGWVPPKTH